MSVIIQPVCFLGMYGSSLVLKVNGIKDGFTTLYWYHEEQPYRLYHTMVTTKVVKINSLNEGYYIFFTKNGDIFSSEMRINFQSRTDMDRLDLLWYKASISSNNYTDDLKNNLYSYLITNPAESLLKSLYKSYATITNPKSTETDLFFNLIKTQEQYENLMSGNWNRDGAGFCKLKYQAAPILDLPPDVSEIIVYDMISDKKQILKQNLILRENTSLKLPEKGYFEIHCVSGNELLCVLKHVNIDEFVSSKIWSLTNSSQEEYDMITEDDFKLSSSADLLSADTKRMILEDKSFEPINVIFPRIEIIEKEINSFVSITIDNLNYARASNHTFFLSGKDINYLDDPNRSNFIRFDVGTSVTVASSFVPAEALSVQAVTTRSSNTSVFNSTAFNSAYLIRNFNPVNFALDSRALLYITDENGNIVSRVTRCCFDNDSISSDDEYQETVRQFEINEYSKRLQQFVYDNYVEAYTYLKEILDRALEHPEVTIDSILLYILNQINSTASTIDRDRLIYNVLKDYFVHRYYVTDFFDSGAFTYRRMKIEADPNEDYPYVLVVLRYEPPTSGFIVDYYPSSNLVIQVNLKNNSKYIVYGISESDYAFSGFLYINTGTKFCQSYLVDTRLE